MSASSVHGRRAIGGIGIESWDIRAGRTMSIAAHPASFLGLPEHARTCHLQ
jgi:hypothetical protein